MIDDCLLSIVYAAWLAASTMPLGFMLGAPCSPCCGGGECGGSKPATDPKDEGTWVPSGTWRGAGGVTWSFTANPGDESGETWFFYGSPGTSKAGGGATLEEQTDWGNICNWYSNKTTSPSTTSGFPAALDKRATRLPPDNAIVHVYSFVSTVNTGPQTVKNIFFWGSAELFSGSEVTSTAAAHDSMGGAVYNGLSENFGTVNGGATFNDGSGNFGTVNGGATFNGGSQNVTGSRNGVTGTVNGGATLNDGSLNFGTINDGATLNDSSVNSRTGSLFVFPFTVVDGIINGGATFNDGISFFSPGAQNFGTVNGGATFNDHSQQGAAGTVNGGATLNGSSAAGGTVNGGATFNDNSSCIATVSGGATFNDTSINFFGTVNGGATFTDNSRNNGTVNDGATFNDNSQNNNFGCAGGGVFNDAACSTAFLGNFSPPCTRKFVAHPTDLPTCNGTAPDGCSTPAASCGCG